MQSSIKRLSSVAVRNGIKVDATHSYLSARNQYCLMTTKQINTAAATTTGMSIQNNTQSSTTTTRSNSSSLSSPYPSSSVSVTGQQSHRRCFATTNKPSPTSTKSMQEEWTVDNPYSGEIVTRIPTLSLSQSSQIIDQSHSFYKSPTWHQTTLVQRISIIEQLCQLMESQKSFIAKDVSLQMGKPLAQAMGEVSTGIARARALCELSPQAHKDDYIAQTTSGIVKKITKESIGVVLCMVPWNYPVVCLINPLVHAILAGNTVLIKQSERSPLCADHFANMFKQIDGGKYQNLVQSFHASNALVSHVIRHNPLIQYVSFTGSVVGGQSVYQSIAAACVDVENPKFIASAMELGGKDSAYVSDDSDLNYSIENVIDGTMYNAGQSCCAIERVYVHKKVYQEFVDKTHKMIKNIYQLGDPLSDQTTMGPIAQPHHVDFIQHQVNSAVKQGATILTGSKPTKDQSGKGRFFQPTLMTNVTHKMDIMNEETFGPVLPIQVVSSDEEAIHLMNDSKYGLTASVWSLNTSRAETIMSQLNVGTVFQNRCDFLDPYLTWSGRKLSGQGRSLSQFGFEPFYKTKSWNQRISLK